MQISKNGINKIKEWEGFENEVYLDSAGLKTIGVGHLLTKDELSSGKIKISGDTFKIHDGLSNAEVEFLLRKDLTGFEKAVDSVDVELSQNQYDALVSFSFNVGTGAFLHSTLLKLLNQRRYDQVPTQLRRWNRSGGKVVPGLIHRRENEIKLWNS